MTYSRSVRKGSIEPGKDSFDIPSILDEAKVSGESHVHDCIITDCGLISPGKNALALFGWDRTYSNAPTSRSLRPAPGPPRK